MPLTFKESNLHAVALIPKTKQNQDRKHGIQVKLWIMFFACLLLSQMLSLIRQVHSADEDFQTVTSRTTSSIVFISMSKIVTMCF